MVENNNSEDLAECCWCHKKSPKSDMNFVFGEYSHKDCDSEYFEKQEKSVRYLDKLQSEQRF